MSEGGWAAAPAQTALGSEPTGPLRPDGTHQSPHHVGPK